MKKEIDKYVRECQVCQQKRTIKKMKIEHEIKRNLKVQKEVSIDYIIKLFRNNEKDSILVIKN